jgi:K(+)-stimulated pyrophosphate-energized sodium pump
VVKYADNTGLRVGVALGALAIVVASVVIAKRRATGIAPSDSDQANGPAAPADDEQPAETSTA